MDGPPEGRLDTTTLSLLGRRAATHPLVTGWRYRPSHRSPRRFELELDPERYPGGTAARVDVRWFDTGDYSVHYTERTDSEAVRYQCRWDRHPKTDAPRSHFHPPPDANVAVESSFDSTHPLDVLFAVLDRIADRIETLFDR